MKIFVQIASYRDPELKATIQHCIERAKNPENLVFGVCWQFDETEDLKSLDCFKNIRLLRIPYKDSKGACWARHKVNQLYNNEDFTLQIDSHMRFVEHWDEKMLEMWRSLNDSRAVLTTYPAMYKPEQKEEEWEKVSHTIWVYNFRNDGQTEQKPHTPKDISVRDKPYKAIHVAAGYIFGPGSLILDAPYDPEFYFSGEETSLTVRLFTKGYNLYHPHKILIYHYYERKGNSKHWDDDKEWVKYNSVATERLDCLLGRNDKFDLGPYGLGSIRSLDDFKNYSGIDYANKKLNLDTLEGKEPPISNDPEKWVYQKATFKKKIEWNFDEIGKCDDPRFWAFIVKDQNNNELYRKDIRYTENPDLFTGKQTSMSFEFDYFTPIQKPDIFMIWPYSESKTWLNNKTWKIPQ